MTWWSIILAVVIIPMVIAGIIQSQDEPIATEGMKRTGRVGLWVAFWPAGLWRSWKHGQKKRDERLAKLIAEETRKQRG